MRVVPEISYKTTSLFLKIWKFWNIHIVGNLIGDIYGNFYDDDIIIVITTPAHTTKSVTTGIIPNNGIRR